MTMTAATRPARLLICVLLGTLLAALILAVLFLTRSAEADASSPNVNDSALTYDLGCVNEPISLNPYDAATQRGPVAHNGGVLVVGEGPAAVLVRCRISDVRRYGVPVAAFTVDTTAFSFASRSDRLTDGSTEIDLMAGTDFDSPVLLPAGDYGAAFSVKAEGYETDFQRASVVGLLVSDPALPYLGDYFAILPRV